MYHTPICIFGEVLVDCLPDGRRILGGAPFNVAWHLCAFGETPYLHSAVGEDLDGQRVRDAMTDWGMQQGGLHTVPNHATGEVLVTLEDGEPAYRILADRAFDHIPEPPGALRCDLLYHGTLALRAPVSAQALGALRAGSGARVFVDVNLRDPFWSRGQVLGLLKGADRVKLNGRELAALLGLARVPAPPDLTARAEDFRAAHDLLGLVVTLGAEGAVAVARGEPPVHLGPAPRPGPGDTADTVGAGDAFASVLILGLRRDWPWALSLERAQGFASRIVRQPGATAADPSLYEPFIDAWDLVPRPPDTAVPAPARYPPRSRPTPAPGRRAGRRRV